MSNKHWPREVPKVQITLLGETVAFGANGVPDEIAIAEAAEWLLKNQRDLIWKREHEKQGAAA